MAQRDTRALVAHLFRRAGFGLRPDELDHFTGLGVQASVDYLVDYDTAVDAAEESDPLPDLSSYVTPELPPAQRTAETQRAAAQARNQARRVIQAWWVQRMLHTTRPLQEKMTLFWHGHFATALTKARPAQMLGQNQLFRAMALSPFEAMLRAVNSDPAMLVWLDGAHNRAGKPNENFSRELMELFTIGLGQFSENDVREGARALTGWTFSYQTGAARFVPRFHSLIQAADTNAYQATIQLSTTQATKTSPVAYPGTAVAKQLKLVSQVIATNLGTRVFMVTQGGYDDHANEAQGHALLVSELGDAVGAFYNDLTAQGRVNQVLLMTVSEFGRRPQENASQGTDHGTAAPMFIVGGGVKGGMYGAAPSLANLDDGNLRFNTDFRSVYSTVLTRWMGADPTPAVLGHFPTLSFV